MEEAHAIHIEVWVCPNCGNYYGASSAGNLADKPQPGRNGVPKDVSRAKCPQCPGIREPHLFTITGLLL